MTEMEFKAMNYFRNRIIKLESCLKKLHDNHKAILRPLKNDTIESLHKMNEGFKIRNIRRIKHALNKKDN